MDIRIEDIIHILHCQESVTQQQHETLMESLSDAFMKTHFDILLEYLVTMGANLEKMPETITNFALRLLQSESLKYGIIMVLEKIVDNSISVVSRYVLQLNSYIYLDLADKSYDTLKKLMENGKILRQNVRNEVENKQLLKQLDNQQTKKTIDKMAQLPIEKILELLRLFDVDHVIHLSQLTNLIKIKQITLQSQNIPLQIFLILYFNKATQHLLTSYHKLTLLSRHQPMNMKYVMELIQLMQQVDGHPSLPNVLFHVLKYIGSQQCSDKNIIQNINVRNEYVWEKVVQLADQPNFKAYCLSRHRQVCQNMKYRILLSVCQTIREVGREQIDLLMEIVNYGLLLKIRGKEMPDKFREKMEEVRKSIGGIEGTEILLFRLDQLL